MAKNTIAYYTKSGRVSSNNVPNSTPVTIFAAGPEGSKILAINAVAINNVSTLTLRVDDGDGNISVLAVLPGLILESNGDVFDYIPLPLTGSGSKYMNLEAGSTITAGVSGSSPITATVSVYGEDY
jgi:hypothetical protein